MNAPETHARSPLPSLLVCAGVCVVTVIVYAPVAGHGFVDFDDGFYVTANPTVQRGLSLEGLRWSLTSGHASNWHPLTWLSHMLDVELFGLDAGAHHVTSLVLHLLATGALFSALRSMGGAVVPSGVVASLFALHPLRVESVAWISERKDVLSGLFFALVLWAHAAYARCGGILRYGSVLVLFLLGLAAKPMLVTLPCVLLLCDWWPLGRVRGGPVGLQDGRPASPPRSPGALVAEKLPLFVLSAASCVVTFLVQRAGGATASGETIPFVERLANAVVAYGLYAAKTVWPADLAIFYPHPGLSGDGWSGAALACAAAFLLVASVAALRFRRRFGHLFVGWFWFVGMLVPVVGVVQVGTQSHADRYGYLPLIGLFLAATWSVDAAAGRVRSRRIAAGALALAVLAACALRTRSQVRVWESSETLAVQALEATEGNWVAHTMLGSVREDQGRSDAAIEHYRAALDAYPLYVEALSNLGGSLAAAGRFDEALEPLQDALRIHPGYVEAYTNLGRALAGSGRRAEAQEALERALELDSDALPARLNLAGILGQSGLFDEAHEHLQEILRREPDHPGAHFNMGMLRGSQGDTRAALRHFRRVLEIDPAHPLAEQARAFLESAPTDG